MLCAVEGARYFLQSMKASHLSHGHVRGTGSFGQAILSFASITELDWAP